MYPQPFDGESWQVVEGSSWIENLLRSSPVEDRVCWRKPVAVSKDSVMPLWRFALQQVFLAFAAAEASSVPFGTALGRRCCCSLAEIPWTCLD